MVKNPNSIQTKKKPKSILTGRSGGCAWESCAAKTGGITLRISTSSTTGSSAAWRRLRFVVVLLLGRALLVLENLPRRSRLWWVEWCSTTGGATIMSAAGGEAGTRGQPWCLLASTPVVESGVYLQEQVAPTMSPMEEARRRAGVDGTDWLERRGEAARRGGGLVESASAASVVHVKGRV